MGEQNVADERHPWEEDLASLMKKAPPRFEFA